jgi:hypothetical protein
MRAPIPEDLDTVREAVEREGRALFGEAWTGAEWREHIPAMGRLQSDTPEIPDFVEAQKASDRRDASVRLQCAYISVCLKLANGQLSAVTIGDDGRRQPVEQAFFLSSFVWLALSEGSIAGAGELFLLRPSPSSEQTVGKNRGGRKALPWDDFWSELVLIANDDGLAQTADGLPETQNTLVGRMLGWCRDHWGEEPGESTVRQRISTLYKRHAERQAERQKST